MIIERTTKSRKGQTQRQKEIASKQVAIDPKYPLSPLYVILIQFIRLAALLKDVVPASRVSNQNYKLFTESLSTKDMFMKESFDRMIEEKRIKTIKQKLQMERTLQEIEDLKATYQIKQQEAQLK